MRTRFLPAAVLAVSALNGTVFAQDPTKRTESPAPSSVEGTTEPPKAAAPAPSLEERVKVLEEAAAKQKAEAEAPGKFKTYWKEGLYFESADKKFKFQFGGRLFVDAVGIHADDDLEAFDSTLTGVGAIGKQEDYADFRAARLFFAGTLYERIEFKAEFDFAEGATTPPANGLSGTPAAFKDVYIGVNKIPVIGNFRVGHYKEWFSLDELTSARFGTFLERGLPNILAPGRNIGASIFNTAFEERMTWAVGIFRDADNYARNLGDGEYAGTGRLTGLPWYAEEGNQLWHLGVAYTTRSPTAGGSGATAASDTIRLRQRPEAHDASRFVDTGNLGNCTDDDRLGLETALVYGPWSLQGEYMIDWINRRSAVDDDLQFDGYYAMASFFVTGENRNYKKTTGAFDRVRPTADFLNGEGGTGAVELAVRYSNIDLIDEGIDGGEMNCYTFGVNWHLNPMTRVMLNFTHADVDHRGGDLGDADILSLRFQVDF